MQQFVYPIPGNFIDMRDETLYYFKGDYVHASASKTVKSKIIILVPLKVPVKCQRAKKKLYATYQYIIYASTLECTAKILYILIFHIIQ